jgi:hypothetical protein
LAEVVPVKWADILRLSDDERLRLLTLADEVHGGSTIVGWIASEISRLRAQAAERDGLIAKMALELERLKKTVDGKPVN